ncbi:alpha-hydroxyketone-type quorum-sensing autoinducer synthase [Paludibacterium purpuratum]|uniref:Putative 8-amino-7-oxononanoate synthase n=1 Tax=Paludibacterium purpuratum TaxID=1144873 RepID=A0A4R7B9L0_9NEIS|nr:alpha-hydroxyketone-type quorum-sensing autoinducer synthase [Paludibacterium purpuratum]TDR81511.1 CAI-1 autoinducer synthase [Paludibacterium purpuratum]
MNHSVMTLHRTKPFHHAPEPAFLARRVEGYYRERVQNTWDGGHIMRGRQPGEGAIHLSSNDYLSLARHPKILRAAAECLLKSGNGLLMSGIFLHGANPLLEFEKRLANFMGAQAGVLCQSGFAANTGLVQSIADENTPVYVDKMAHMSLWEGIRSAGAQAVAFHHNDMEHLNRQILKYGPGVILVDSVYSTNGSVCPLDVLVEVGASHGCVLVVDESHSLGTHGVHGEGLVAALGLCDKVHFRTASLAKAFAGRAGFITCSERFSEYFKFEANPAIFSSTLLPHEIAGLDATLTVIRDEPWRRKALHGNAAYLRDHLDDLGYNLNGCQSQIIALESGTERQTIALRDALEARGIFGSVFCAPATAKNRALIRLSINGTLTDDELARIVDVCRQIRDEVGMADWASTRRKKAQPPVIEHREAIAAVA